MRALILLAPFCLLFGCAAPRAAQHYSAPNVAPVRQRIANAQSHLSTAAQIAKEAKAAATIELKNQFIDQFYLELTAAQSALNAAEDKARNLQLQNDSLAKSANHEATARETAEVHDAATSRRYHTVKFYLCTCAAAVALLLALKFRWLFALLGPWGIVAGVGGLPAVVFGALWLWL